jgi:O-antigen ligase
MQFQLILLNKINIFFIIILPVALLLGTFVSETIICLICLNFIINSYFKNNWRWIEGIELKILIIIWLYLILNSIVANNINLSFSRGFFFFRFILLAYAISDILKEEVNKKMIFFFWSLLVVLTAADIYYEFLNKKNIFGNFSTYNDRIASFTGDELKIGGFTLALFLTSLSFFIKNKIDLIKFSIVLFSLLLILFAIILTGERSNSIRAIFCIILFLFFMKRKFKIFKYLSLAAILAITLFLVSNINQVANRYAEIIRDFDKPIFFMKDNLHGAHYSTAIKIFKNYPYFGVGNKNFREECKKEIYFDNSYKYSEYRCSTHPHQIYLEFLSELGLLGFFLIIFFVLYLIKKSIIKYLKNKNIQILAPTFYIISIFLPLIPSGSFFTSFGATLFWINIGVIFSYLNKKR